MSTTPKPTPQPDLKRDERLKILTLRDAGFTYQAICNQLGFTYRQVQHTCQSQRASPRKPRGQSPKLSEEKMDEIIAWITASKENRRKPYHKVIEELDLNVTPMTLRLALKKRDFTRCKALRKPPLSSQHRRVCLAWALEHVNWDYE